MAESLETRRQWIPGEAVAQVLRNCPVADHKPLLAYLEQESRREGDIDALRDIKAYRNRLARQI